jgi:hypothetical protein
MITYIDTSVLLKLLLDDEDGSDAVHLAAAIVAKATLMATGETQLGAAAAASGLDTSAPLS